MKRLVSLFVSALLALSALLPAIPAKAAETNLIANPSVENVNPNNANLPQNWSKNRWGTNTGTLKYETTGRTGGRSLYAQLKTYTDGDAKWVFKHVAVGANTSYVYSDYYKSNVATNVVVEAKNTANQLSYQWLGTLPAATEWTQGTFEYTTPANIKSITVLHVVNSVGWLATDDYSLTAKVATPLPVPPTVSITSPTKDSTVSGNVTVAADASDEKSVLGVQFMVDGAASGPEDTSAPYGFSWDTKTVSNGAHTLKAIARDADGLTATSEVNVTVNNQTTPPTDPPVNPPADPTNLVANPSVETSANNAPEAWLSNSWGTNSAQFTYENSGKSGSHSVKTTLRSYSSGDAKWYFSPVNSRGSHTYAYKDYYKSAQTSRVVAASYDASGAATYIDVNYNVPAASDWTQFTGQFTVPANSAKVTVFHFIDSVGSLSIDDAYLGDKGAPTPDTGTVPNGSLETASTSNPASPDKWSPANWGSNTPVYEYMNDGHTGSRSVKVTLSNYVNGDAKWLFNPISLERGSQYRFSTWYKTNTTPHVVAMYTRDDGTEQYFGMPNPVPNGSSNWQYYSDTFSVPTNAKNVSVFMFVSSNGYVQTDDYDIVPYTPTGFNRPLVTLTFDDGHEDNVANALPLLNSYGFKTTQCYATDFVEGNAAQMQNVLAFYNSGHEICSHTVSHPFLTSLNSTQLAYELSHSQQVLQNIIGQPVRNFASPYGDYNQTVNNEIKKYYQSHRTVDEGYNSKDNFDIYRLRVQNIQSTTTLAEVQSWIDHAKATNTWLILVYHRVANDPGQFDSYISDFNAQLQAIKNSGITVKTYQGALDEVLPQL